MAKSLSLLVHVLLAACGLIHVVQGNWACSLYTLVVYVSSSMVLFLFTRI